MTTMTNPSITVCIANYNGGQLVLDSLESVFTQEGDFALEVLVHDDASTDDSVSRIRHAYPDVKIIESVGNVGFCVANNRMVEAAAGYFVLLLNNDALLRPSSLQALLQATKVHGTDCILGLSQHMLHGGALVDRGYRTDLFLNPIPRLGVGDHQVGVVTGACLWTSKRIWNEVGGLPDFFDSVAEDIYFCLAARLLGYPVIAVHEPGFDHWIGRHLGGGKLDGNRMQTSVRRRALSERNKTFAMLCCYPWPTLIALMPLHAILLACEAAFLAISGAGVIKVARIYSNIPSGIWRHRKSLRALRRRLMQRRKVSARRLFAFSCWFPHKLTMLVRHGRPQLD